MHLLVGRLMANHGARNRRSAMHPCAAGHHDPHGAVVHEPSVVACLGGVPFPLGGLRQRRGKEIVNARYRGAVGLKSPDRRRAEGNLLETRILGLGSARDTSGNRSCGVGHVQWLARGLALHGSGRGGQAGEHNADKARIQEEPLHGAYIPIGAHRLMQS